MGIYGRIFSSARSSTTSCVVVRSLLVGSSLPRASSPTGVAFSSASIRGGDKISVTRVVVGSESVLVIVSDRYVCAAICNKSRRPSNSYPGRCSPGNSRLVNI